MLHKSNCRSSPITPTPDKPPQRQESQPPVWKPSPLPPDKSPLAEILRNNFRRQHPGKLDKPKKAPSPEAFSQP